MFTPRTQTVDLDHVDQCILLIDTSMFLAERAVQVGDVEAFKALSDDVRQLAKHLREEYNFDIRMLHQSDEGSFE